MLFIRHVPDREAGQTDPDPDLYGRDQYLLPVNHDLHSCWFSGFVLIFSRIYTNTVLFIRHVPDREAGQTDPDPDLYGRDHHLPRSARRRLSFSQV